MRKYGKLLLVLAVLAAVPSIASAEGLLSGLRSAPAASPNQKAVNQQHAEQVKQALRNAQIESQDISIEVVNGVARLTGTVTVPGHRMRAGKACEQIPGITRVNNQLKYGPNKEIKAKIRSLPLLDRAVKLAGYQPDAATPTSEEVPPIPSPEQAPVESGPSNQQVAEQIGASLLQAGLQGYDVSIRYQKGVATLSGPVETPNQRAAAEAATQRVPGVQQVVNQITVSPISAARQQQMVTAMQASRPQPITPTAYQQPMPPMQGSAMQPTVMPASASAPMAMGGAGFMSHPNLPAHAWPAYAQYPNSAAVTYPTQYSASAFPYIGPFYPYPQVPMGWREVRLRWDDGFWQLNFNKDPNVWQILFPRTLGSNN